MKDFDWRLQYAPKGYYFEKRQVTFEQFDRYSPALIIQSCMDQLLYRLSGKAGDVSPSDVFTKITVFPKQIGETVNHLDPLVPRFGIEIEVRYPREN